MKQVSVAVVIMAWILDGGRCFAELKCPEGAKYVTHTNFEYCVATDAEGKDWYHGPFVRYFDHNVHDENGNPVFPNDEKQEVGTYNMGKREGVWTQYHENGAKSSETPYVRDEANGVSRRWDANGMLREEIEYKDGKPPLYYGMTPEQEAASRAASSSPEVQQNIQRLQQYLKAHPQPIDPCEEVERRSSEWIEANSGRADYEQFEKESAAKGARADQCYHTPEYQQYEKDRDAEAAAFTKQLKKWSEQQQ